MLKHVLVPLDSSELAENALPYAQQIVADDGRITLLMILEDVNLAFLAPSVDFQLNPKTQEILSEQQEETQKYAQDYLDRIATTLDKNIQIEKIWQIGTPAEEIVNFANNTDVDVVVMSTHGRTGLSRWVLGSVTQKVLNSATCPVFVVKQMNQS